MPQNNNRNNNRNNAPRFLSGSEAVARTAVGQRAASQPVFSEGSRQSQVGAQNYRAPAPAAPQAPAPARSQAPAPPAQSIPQPTPGQGPGPWAPAATDQYAAPPEFDWDAWNAEMMAKQAAVWEAMDAMNSAFLQQQSQWQQTQPQTQRPQNSQATSTSPDGAKVRRNKKAKSSTASSTNTAIGSSSSGGVSLGGAKNGNNGLSIGKA